MNIPETPKQPEKIELPEIAPGAGQKITPKAYGVPDEKAPGLRKDEDATKNQNNEIRKPDDTTNEQGDTVPGTKPEMIKYGVPTLPIVKEGEGRK